MNSAYLLLGSNLGDRDSQLEAATGLISQRVGTITSASSIYETAPWAPDGVSTQGQLPHLNRALLSNTVKDPGSLLREILLIENELGRLRTEKWGSRTIDIDLLCYNSVILQTPELTLPHPFLHLRRFALAPLAEIAPDLIHPLLKKTVAELLRTTPDKGWIAIHNEQHF